MNEENDSIFVTKKLNIVIDNSKPNYSKVNEIPYNAEVLKSNVCDYNDTYILVRGDVIVAAAGATKVEFKKCVQFTKCIIKTDEKTIDDAVSLDLIMAMYNLTEYSSNYSATAGSLWFYSKDEATDFNPIQDGGKKVSLPVFLL